MKRIVTALIAGAGWLFLLFSGSFLLFWLAFSTVIGLGLYEYFAMLCVNRHRDDILFGITAGLLPALAAYYQRQDLVCLALILSLLLLFGRVICRYGVYDGAGFDTLCRYCFGIIYIGFFAGHLVLVMSLANGPLWLVLLTSITIASDSTAYYAGSYLGRTKLCPSISPGKTVEGLIGGIIGSLVIGLLVARFLLPAIPPVAIGLVAVLISAISMASDLVESMVKRATGIKDSGKILPGHGGILDRIDSLLASAPVFYYLIHFGVIKGG